MNTKDFNNLKKQQLLYGFKTCHKNANSHFQTAIICADKDYFGIANSHLILAAEEAIKAHHFMIKYLTPSQHLNVDGLFHSHIAKHVAGFAFYKGIKKASTTFYNRMNEIALKIAEKSKNQKQIDEVKQFIKEAEQFKKEFQNTKIKTWWKKANDQKNKGFYVGRINQKWLTPQKDIGKNDYLQSYSIVGHFLFLNDLIEKGLNSS